MPYLRKFAQEFGVELPPEAGWHTLAEITDVPPEEKDRFRVQLYDSTFFGDLDMYADCPAVLERMVAAGHELYFITARAERRRVVTETWLREKGLLEHAKAVHLRPYGDFDPARVRPRGRYDAEGSARFKVRLAQELELDAFCEDDRTISLALAEARIRVFLFDHAWNRDAEHACIERVRGWEDVARKLGL